MDDTDFNRKANSPEPLQDDGKRDAAVRRLFLLGGILSLSFVFVFSTAHGQTLQSISQTVDGLFRAIGLSSDPASATTSKASPAVFSEHLLEQLDSQTAQEQAELLMQSSINSYAGAIEQIGSRVDGWHGHLNRTDSMMQLITTGLNSNDLRVRAASIEVQLAINNVTKDAGAVDAMRGAIDNPGSRAYALWNLGALGNRGIQTEQVREIIQGYLNDPDPQTRQRAVNGYELLGTDETIAPLLDRFRNDSSPAVREAAACALAQSGMFTTEQRMKAVPELLKLTDDPALDKQTQGWAFQALRDITGQSLPSDSAAWRNWYSARDNK